MTVTFQYRPGVGAPIIGPDGINDSGLAYAPTPGMGEQLFRDLCQLWHRNGSTSWIGASIDRSLAVPRFGGSRRLMQAVNTSPFTKQTFENRYIVYESIDVEVLGYGGSNSSLIDIKHPVQLDGFLTVLMSQQGINVSRMSRASLSKWRAPCTCHALAASLAQPCLMIYERPRLAGTSALVTTDPPITHA